MAEESKKDMQQQDDSDVAAEKKEKKGRKAKASGRKDPQAEKIQEMGEKLDELNDKYLRLFSEFDNFRKRTQKEKLELFKTASEDVMTALLPVLDDFERALKTSGEGDVDKNHIEGIELIYNKLKKTLSQKGLEPMKVIGEEFNTDFHEAITNVPAPTPDMKGKVVDVVENGYLLNDKVIRFARVVVGN
jgi:molecular chaperone GrpE